MEPRTAYWVTKERYDVFRVESALGPSSRCILDRRTMQVKAQERAGSTFGQVQLGNDPVSRAVMEMESRESKKERPG